VESRESVGDDGLPPDLGISKSNLPLGSAAFTSSPHRRQAVEGRARCLAGAAKHYLVTTALSRLRSRAAKHFIPTEPDQNTPLGLDKTFIIFSKKTGKTFF
jgi:hypothetical protein